MPRLYSDPDFTLSDAVAAMARQLAEQHNRLQDCAAEKLELIVEVRFLRDERTRLEQELRKGPD